MDISFCTAMYGKILKHQNLTSLIRIPPVLMIKFPLFPLELLRVEKQPPKNDAEISTYIPTEVRLDPSMNLYPDLLRVNPTFMVNL